jgi:A118 family predicted phage portal protein
MLRSVDADAAVPDFQWGQLVAVTFWHVVGGSDYLGGTGLISDDKEVWRLLERHEPGFILTGLYKGTRTHLGISMPLDALGLAALPDPVVETLIDDLTAVYVPNVRPNRVFRGTPLGRSDYDGIEAEMDALDESATSLMRDLRLARARLIVAGGLLETQGKGKGAKFDLDQEVWEEAPTGIPNFGADNLITPSQFAIRADDHLKIIKSKIETIIIAAGYSSTSFGFDEPRRVPATATEIVNRERQSFLTRSKKIAYWTTPIEDILEAMLEIDAQHFQPHGVARPRVDFADSIRDDAQQTATVVHTLRSAEAASAEIRVRMVHPKWSDTEVEAEAKRILAEGALPVKPPNMSPMPVSPNGQPADQPKDGMRPGNFSELPSEGE